MLTKTDLKAIEMVFDNRLDIKLDSKLDEKLKPIHSDIKIIKKDVKKLQKDVNGVILFADKGLLSTQKRIRNVESVLKIPSPDFI